MAQYATIPSETQAFELSTDHKPDGPPSFSPEDVVCVPCFFLKNYFNVSDHRTVFHFASILNELSPISV